MRIARAISYLEGMAHGFAINANNPVKQHISMLYEIIFYLIGSTITNRQLRDFLSISSSSSATRILQSLNLTSSSVNKGRVYRLNFDE
ncbi:hypothetical protein RCO48_13910 [Peribacillus frigoritolerans]|nr:hypothetical protein [Peribacillus frigoritolerans]